MPDLVTIEVPVKVKGVKVTDAFDSKYKDAVEKRIKPQLEKALAKIKVQVPKGKKPGAFAVDVSVSVKRTDKGVMVEVRTAQPRTTKCLVEPKTPRRFHCLKMPTSMTMTSIRQPMLRQREPQILPSKSSAKRLKTSKRRLC